MKVSFFSILIILQSDSPSPVKSNKMPGTPSLRPRNVTSPSSRHRNVTSPSKLSRAKCMVAQQYDKEHHYKVRLEFIMCWLKLAEMLVQKRSRNVYLCSYRKLRYKNSCSILRPKMVNHSLPCVQVWHLTTLTFWKYLAYISADNYSLYRQKQIHKTFPSTLRILILCL